VAYAADGLVGWEPRDCTVQLRWDVVAGPESWIPVRLLTVWFDVRRRPLPLSRLWNAHARASFRGVL